MKNLHIKIFAIACVLAPVGAKAQEGNSVLRISQSECREMAISYSEDLQKAGNSVSQAELDSKIARTAFLPDFAGSATGAYMVPDMDMLGSELRMRGTYMAGITLTQPIYAGGRIISGKKLAKIGEESAQEQERAAMMDVIQEADEAYWTLIAVNQKVRMMESYCEQMDTLLAQVRASVEAGMATDNDLLRVEAERSNILYQTKKVRNGADLCRLSLCRVIGVEPDVVVEPTDTEIEVVAPGFLSSEIGTRPEMRLLGMQVEAQEQQIKMTRGDMLPSIGLTAGYTYYGNLKLAGTTSLSDGTMVPYTQEFRDGIGIAMLAVSIPIFHWGEARNKVRKARFDLLNAQLDMQKNSRLMSLEVQQAIRNLQDGYEMVRMAEIGMGQAEESLRVTGNRYSASMAPLTDLLDSQSQWEQARSNLIEAQTQFKIYETAYLRSVGQLE